jgi:hypothetical protein
MQCVEIMYNQVNTAMVGVAALGYSSSSRYKHKPLSPPN